ncbi:MAG: hypothetical protein AAF492_26650, partial [Verrucomicrobiota bacterium]
TADTDRDGLLNVWEQQHGLNPNHAIDAGQDPDGDGETNLEEFLADTDPGDARSLLQFLGVDPDATLRWMGGRAVKQVLECASTLDGPWIPVYTNLPPTDVNVLWRHATEAGPLRFYRIRVEPRTFSSE